MNSALDSELLPAMSIRQRDSCTSTANSGTRAKPSLPMVAATFYRRTRNGATRETAPAPVGVSSAVQRAASSPRGDCVLRCGASSKKSDETTTATARKNRGRLQQVSQFGSGSAFPVYVLFFTKRPNLLLLRYVRISAKTKAPMCWEPRFRFVRRIRSVSMRGRNTQAGKSV